MAEDTGMHDREILDLRELEPPGPMVEIFRAIANLTPGQELTALLPRFPIFLVPHLEKAGHRFEIDQVDGSTWKIRITKGATS